MQTDRKSKTSNSPSMCLSWLRLIEYFEQGCSARKDVPTQCKT